MKNIAKKALLVIAILSLIMALASCSNSAKEPDVSTKKPAKTTSNVTAINTTGIIIAFFFVILKFFSLSHQKLSFNVRILVLFHFGNVGTNVNSVIIFLESDGKINKLDNEIKSSIVCILY